MLPEQVVRRLKLLHGKCGTWNNKPESIPREEREELSLMFAATFKSFKHFAELGMKYLGFDLSEIQADIAEFMQYGQSKRMVQAQRGQAKSTLAALYCIWLLIQNPSTRVLIVSGGGDQADAIAIIIVRIIMNWSILCWLRPDTTKGDRDSTKNFDVHYHLKGIDKSASIASVGITANLQGKRADFILADDVETQKNSMTQPMREQLLTLTKEFAAICITGDILYLGTPQTKDSVYRALPARGYDVRVWTGRYPTDEELQRYGAGTQIAPSILEAMLSTPELQSGGGITGTRGKPTDPNHISEDILQEKELEYGDEGFALQYMLDTTLSDAMRTKIKLSDVIVLGVGSDEAPETVQWTSEPNKGYKELTPALQAFRMYWGTGVSEKHVPYQHKVMTLDPSGSGGDELSFAAGGATNSYIYVFSVGGFIGGCSEKNINNVLLKMIELGIKDLQIEKNMGHGTVTSLFQAQIEKLRLKASTASQDEDFINLCTNVGLSASEFYNALSGLGVADYYVTGQKEKRIIDTISPLTRRHKLVVSSKAIQEDWEYCLQHPSERRTQFSAFFQLGNITYDRNSLVHDDRADAVQALVERLNPFLARDEEKASVMRQESDNAKWIQNPMGYSEGTLRELNRASGRGRGKMLVRRRR